MCISFISSNLMHLKYINKLKNGKSIHLKISMDFNHYVTLLSSYSFSDSYDVDGLFVGLIAECILFLL